MRQQGFINENEIRKTISILQEEGSVFEIRIIGTAKKDIISGYFRDADTLIKALDTVDLRNRNVYITLGKVKAECFSRTQSERFRSNVQTTSDGEILGYRWLFIDLDPVRTAGISSSDEELNESKLLARKVYAYLDGLGFEEPVKALSGNGCHLLYRISVQNDDEGTALIERCLKVLSSMFDTDKVKIDTTNYNPSRICKLHGSLAQKGTSTPDRPHRMSRIFSGTPDMPTTSKASLQRLADELPETAAQTTQPPRQRNNSYSSNEFDLIDFMSRNGMSYQEDSNDRATIYKLDECPFNPTHRDGDAKIFHYHNGAIAFKCHHNSCRQYRWQDVRTKYDPSAYDREYIDHDAAIDLGWQKHNRAKAENAIPYTELTEQNQADIFRTAKEIYNDPEPEYEYIRSGITVIDTKLKGLQKTALSVVSGTRASGKSTLIGQIIINAINDGHNVVCYSGELNNKKYLKWLMRQAAGKNHVTTTASGVSISKDDEKKIVEWMGDKFRLYNNKFGNKFSAIEQHLRGKLKDFKADLCVIDNLMALDLSEYDRDKYDAQTSFVWALKNLAELTNTHIIFVAHPKKVNGFIRLNDISGSGNIANIVDNAFLVHRCNRDFENGYKDTFGNTPSQDGIKRATNVIEIAKDREYGTQDEFIQLFFEESTKRLRNSEDEYVAYGWNSEDDFTTDIPDDIPF